MVQITKKAGLCFNFRDCLKNEIVNKTSCNKFLREYCFQNYNNWIFTCRIKAFVGKSIPVTFVWSCFFNFGIISRNSTISTSFPGCLLAQARAITTRACVPDWNTIKTIVIFNIVYRSYINYCIYSLYSTLLVHRWEEISGKIYKPK